MKLKTILGGIALAIIVAGCSTTTPPTKFESKLFEIQTNYVDKIAYQTNVVWQTNPVVSTFYTTNAQNIVIPVYQTNLIPLPFPQLVTITQHIPDYIYSQGTNAQVLRDTAGAIGNLAAPGVGGPIASGIVGLGLALWQWVRNRKSTAAASSLVQAVQVGRQLLQAVPSGPQIDAQYKKWLFDNQKALGVLPVVMDLVDRVVDTDAARQVTDQIRQGVVAATKP